MGSCIKLDFDQKIDFDRLCTSIEVYTKHSGNKLKDLDLYRTTNGWHCYLYFSKDIAPVNIVALQAIMGSDYIRELFNLFRANNNNISDRDWNVLFRKKYEFNPATKRVFKRSSESKDYYREKILRKRLKLCL